MKLQAILQGLEPLEVHADLSREITGICYDSRAVKPGNLFVAICGYDTDGHKYIPMALEKGAACVLCEKAPAEGEYVLLSDTRRGLALAGANWYGNPAGEMTMIGITGTNGKTTTTYLVKHILEDCLGAKVGLVGTIQNMIGDEVLHTERTTPESLELQALFRHMADAGCTHVVMEVSSHALSLHRVDGVTFDVGVFTNLTQDHLDFHKTMEEYCRAKAMLFARSKVGAVNVDDPWAKEILAHATCPVITYSAKGQAALEATDIRLEPHHVAFTAHYQGTETACTLGIPGAFSVYNALSALSAALALGIAPEKAAASLATARGVKGRAEVVPTPGKDYTVLIDYSHTPDSLENILKTVREFARGRVIAVFGCGGDRDPIKRPIMGKIAADLADLVVVTSDNPRTEDPMAIIDQILVGIPKDQTPTTVIENRRQAIRWAMDNARAGDVIVLAGKGHETYQEIGHEKFHLDEREEVAAHLMGN
ncbi:MAG TPA: UDP-N-acetylmuramoyl-L-alanyl-D-glutamate--2,6-diaminopimelate ligase [Candidatus Avoscillospira stercoripullorum]|uniref:UDP-N-acetylmuramoyl-L-alanyl-D-glutamate--2,6-diaminopimelate ligase n=1 Tax=Candidatus Avoscillospira stercoripullorum TaxID=2840709 RepID=A0A9D1A8Q4_9FIRM|nr:UDP-N-acetylmuramoyl-L-alanyl-D-glutamate--2,6-diaminopimelate ligase [Candidatus Avoscillospira stercoripullorum]